MCLRTIRIKSPAQMPINCGTRVTVGAGKVELLVRNSSAEPHELVIVKTNSPASHLPVEGGRVDERAAGANYGEADDLAPGEHRSLSLSLPSGRYVMFCNLPGHYGMGMYAVLNAR